MKLAKQLTDAVTSMTDRELIDALYGDPLTGLFNRRAFELAEYDSVAIVDMDSLKYINDAMGHRTGDAYLCKLARALAHQFGIENVFRLSGDEFVITGIHSQLGMARVWSVFPSVSFGCGATLDAADKRLRADKAHRERIGKRAPRGECPPWLKETMK